MTTFRHRGLVLHQPRFIVFLRSPRLGLTSSNLFQHNLGEPPPGNGFGRAARQQRCSRKSLRVFVDRAQEMLNRDIRDKTGAVDRPGYGNKIRRIVLDLEQLQRTKQAYLVSKESRESPNEDSIELSIPFAHVRVALAPLKLCKESSSKRKEKVPRRSPLYYENVRKPLEASVTW